MCVCSNKNLSPFRTVSSNCLSARSKHLPLVGSQLNWLIMQKPTGADNHDGSGQYNWTQVPHAVLESMRHGQTITSDVYSRPVFYNFEHYLVVFLFVMQRNVVVRGCGGSCQV